MSVNSDKAVSYFCDGFNCSQAVLISYSEELGLDKENALKIACAFGGGMSHTGEACGAVTGALMLIGLKYGKYKKEDSFSKEKTYTLAQKYTNAFKDEHGSIKCKELLPYDISNSEGLKKARESNVFTTICPKLVESSVNIIEKVLKEEI